MNIKNITLSLFLLSAMAPNEDRNSNSITKLRLECKDGFLHITGGAQTEIKLNKIFLGYLTIKDLRELSLVSKDIHEIAQEPISAIKRHIDYLAFPIRNENIEEQEKYLIEYGILELRENPRTLEDLRAEGIYDSPMAIYRNYHINKNKFLNQEMLAILNCTSLEESRISYLKERLSFFLFSTNRMKKSDNEFLHLRWSALQKFAQDRVDFANIEFPNNHFDVQYLIPIILRDIHDPILSTFESQIQFIENFSLFIVNQIEGSIRIKGSIRIEGNDLKLIKGVNGSISINSHNLKLGETTKEALEELASQIAAKVKVNIKAINDMHLKLAKKIINYMDENFEDRESQLDWIKKARQFEIEKTEHLMPFFIKFNTEHHIRHKIIFNIILNLYSKSIHYNNDNEYIKMLVIDILKDKANLPCEPIFFEIRLFSETLLKIKKDLASSISKMEENDTELEMRIKWRIEQMEQSNEWKTLLENQILNIKKMAELETKIKDKIFELEIKEQELDEWEILFEKQELEKEILNLNNMLKTQHIFEKPDLKNELLILELTLKKMLENQNQGRLYKSTSHQQIRTRPHYKERPQPKRNQTRSQPQPKRNQTRSQPQPNQTRPELNNREDMEEELQRTTLGSKNYNARNF